MTLDNYSLLTEWTAWGAAAGNREKTIRNRTTTLLALSHHAGKPLAAITRADLIAYLGRAALSPATKSNYRSIFIGFYAYLQDEGHRIDNPAVRLPRQRIIRAEPNPLTTSEIQALLECGIYQATRDKVLLAAYQGFRAIEIASVHSSVIDLARERMRTIDAKNGHLVWRPMHPLIVELAQRMPDDGWWFPSPYAPGEHVTANNVSRVLNDALKRAGIIGHRAHQLRAWFATEQLNAGIDSYTVSANMRHTSREAIRHYARPTEAAEREALNVLPMVRPPARSGRGRATVLRDAA